jgi:hypothetical protein
VTIPQPVLEAAIAALEVHVQHPGTGALHDPIYGLLQGEADQLEALSVAMLDQVGHPAAAQLRELLDAYVALPVPSIEAVVARHGGLQDVEPIGEIDRMLSDAVAARGILSARVGALEADAQALGRTANGMAAVGALVAVFGIIGWLVALGWLQIAWIEPAVPQNINDAAAGRGTVAPSERSVR